MIDEKNQNERAQTTVEFQITPCTEKDHKPGAANDHQNEECFGKITFTVICKDAKFTKTDSEFNEEHTHEVWAKAKMTKSDLRKLPDIEVDVHEVCGSKLTKADAGLV